MLRARRWHPYSHLFLAGDWASWVIDEEMRSLTAIARELGVPVAERRLLGRVKRQSVFFGSQFDLLGRRLYDREHRVGTAYFHGLPGTPGYPEFDEVYEELRRSHARIDRLQVSHSAMRDVVLGSGIDPAKVHLIPIGIDLSLFPIRDVASRAAIRRGLGLPLDAPVIGSMQKDGVGWDKGLEPKLIKGPDVFVEVVARLRDRVPGLHVLLTGPSRGYVRAGLERLGVPYVHVFPRRYQDVAPLYAALDAYVVTSRQEGGPKAVLESMAAGVSLVTTRVGQATDIVVHEENAYMVEINDLDGLVHFTERSLLSPDAAMLRRGRLTAEAHTYEAQLPLWRSLLDGFVAS